jgi:hypothetical protein
MIGRRAAAAGIATRLGRHSFRATGITAYRKNGGTRPTGNEAERPSPSRDGPIIRTVTCFLYPFGRGFHQ